jgi:hypothetical protein
LGNSFVTEVEKKIRFSHKVNLISIPKTLVAKSAEISLTLFPYFYVFLLEMLNQDDA